jgi:3-oxoacyl-[acyl-carrier-protein] synthase I
MKKESIRIAITGIGMVTPLGHDTKSTWEALMAGKSGISSVGLFDASSFPTKIAAEVKNLDFPKKKFGKSGHMTNRCGHFALMASEEAFEDADIRPTLSTSERWGAVVGTGVGSTDLPTEYWSRFESAFYKEGNIDYQKLISEGENLVSVPNWVQSRVNSTLGALLYHYQIQGYSTAIHTACASGGQAIGLALDVLRRGEVDYLLAGGFDSMIHPFQFGGFCLLGAMSTQNDTPQSASRPFDKTRDGFVLGEGAAFFILERYCHALSRGAKIYAELSGHGNTLSAYRITDSPENGDGPCQAIQVALEDAGLQPEEIDYINAHGTSTQMNDLSETNAIKKALRSQAYQIPISSTKSQTGHLIAAAGALEAAFCALAIDKGELPMTKNLKVKDPGCDLNYLSEGTIKKRVRAALSNSFGFGGSNSCLVFREPR